FEAERLRGLQVDDEVEPCWLLDRQVARTGPAQDLYDIARRPPPQVSPTGAIACEATHDREFSEFRHQGQPVGEDEFANLLLEREREGFRECDNRIRGVPPDCSERGI